MYYLSPYVRYVDISGRITILDIRSESYFALEPLASMMWKELAEGDTEAQSLTGIIRQTGSDDPELAEDLASFAGQCVDKGLLTLVPDVLPGLEVKKRAVRRWRFAAVRAWLCLARATRSLSHRGFCRTYLDALDVPAVFDVTDPGPLLRQGSESLFTGRKLFSSEESAPRLPSPVTRPFCLPAYIRSAGGTLHRHQAISFYRTCVDGVQWARGSRRLL